MADLATQYPTTPAFQSVNFKVNTPTQTTETMVGKIRRVGMGVSYYSWEARYNNLTPLDAGTVKGYLAQTLGPQFSFEIIIPEVSFTKLPNQTGVVPATSGSAQVGATSVTITGMAGAQNVLAAGDFFKFQNHTKVYQCVAPCISNPSGVATLFFSGPLQTSVPSNTPVRITAVPFTAIMAEDVQEWETGIGGITTMTVAMRETW